MLYVTLLYGRSVDVGYPSLLLGCAVVVSAVFSGYLLSKTFPKTRKHVSILGQTAGVALMALGALANTSSSDPVWGNELTWFAAVTLPVIGGRERGCVGTKGAGEGTDSAHESRT